MYSPISLWPYTMLLHVAENLILFYKHIKGYILLIWLGNGISKYLNEWLLSSNYTPDVGANGQNEFDKRSITKTHF